MITPNSAYDQFIESTNHATQTQAWDWALQTVARADLNVVLTRMSDKQLAIFKAIADRVEVDVAFTMSVTPVTERVERLRAVLAKEEEYERARNLISTEQVKRGITN